MRNCVYNLVEKVDTKSHTIIIMSYLAIIVYYTNARAVGQHIDIHYLYGRG